MSAQIITRRRLREQAVTTLLAVVITMIVASGCSLTKPAEDPTRFYLLKSREGAGSVTTSPASTNRWKIGLRPIEIPNYLKATTMAVRRGPNEINYADYSRWAEPLDQGIARLCREALTRLANVESVAVNSRGGNGIDCEITLRVLECEGVREGSGTATISFKVAWEIRIQGDQPSNAHGTFEAKRPAWNATDYGQLAEHLSGAVEQLGETLAVELKGKKLEKREQEGKE